MHIAERLNGETGRDYAMRVLKDNIIRLELEPGSIISDRELAAEMSLSRTPVREAFLELAKVKIVEIYPQRGPMVQSGGGSPVHPERSGGGGGAAGLRADHTGAAGAA